MASLGNEFTFSVYSRRWGRNDKYSFFLTATGWNIGYVAIKGDCTPNGDPYLFKNLSQDSIQYPIGLGNALQGLFNAHGQLTNDELQAELQRLADWISATEQATPVDGAFKGLF